MHLGCTNVVYAPLPYHNCGHTFLANNQHRIITLLHSQISHTLLFETSYESNWLDSASSELYCMVELQPWIEVIGMGKKLFNFKNKIQLVKQVLGGNINCFQAEVVVINN